MNIKLANRSDNGGAANSIQQLYEPPSSFVIADLTTLRNMDSKNQLSVIYQQLNVQQCQSLGNKQLCVKYFAQRLFHKEFLNSKSFYRYCCIKFQRDSCHKRHSTGTKEKRRFKRAKHEKPFKLHLITFHLAYILQPAGLRMETNWKAMRNQRRGWDAIMRKYKWLQKKNPLVGDRVRCLRSSTVQEL